MTLLAAEQLDVSIAGIEVCRGLDLAVEPGQCWGVLGRNGVGKTTLLHTLAHLRRPDGGTITLQGRPLAEWSSRELARRRGVLLQDNHDPFPATVMETALIGRHPYTPAWRMESDADRERARAALGDVALEALADREVATLSGGERQRLALATILTQAPEVYLLDEPTNHLDLRYQVGLLDLLTARVKEQGKAAVMTLHDVNIAARYCDHLILLLGDGEAAVGETEAMLSEDYLHRLYRHCIVKVEADGRRAFLPG